MTDDASWGAMSDPPASPFTPMDVNPYAAPPTVDTSEDLSTDEVRVDGRDLVVGRQVRLPPRCVITNEPVGEAYRCVRELTWAPSMRLVIQSRKCLVSYCLSRRKRNKRRLIAVAALLAGGAFSFWAGAGVLFTVVVLPVVVVRVAGSAPLKVSHYENGRFWIRGCSREFLETCRREFGDL